MPTARPTLGRAHVVVVRHRLTYRAHVHAATTTTWAVAPSGLARTSLPAQPRPRVDVLLAAVSQRCGCYLAPAGRVCGQAFRRRGVEDRWPSTRLWSVGAAARPATRPHSGRTKFGASREGASSFRSPRLSRCLRRSVPAIHVRSGHGRYVSASGVSDRGRRTRAATSSARDRPRPKRGGEPMLRAPHAMPSGRALSPGCGLVKCCSRFRIQLLISVIASSL